MIYKKNKKYYKKLRLMYKKRYEWELHNIEINEIMELINYNLIKP